MNGDPNRMDHDGRLGGIEGARTGPQVVDTHLTLGA